MPELPEVETVRRSLEKLVNGKTIENVIIRYPKIIRIPDDVNSFKIMVIGQTINNIGRKGKYLLFYLDDITLISHLRMEGKYLFSEGNNDDYDKHTHIIFKFTDDTKLLYRDVRKFGTMDLMPSGKEKELAGLNKLGQEPIDLDFNMELFKTQVTARKAPIKQILLNQEIISGLGNIYVDEVLAKSKIHPLRIGQSISDDEIKKLAMSMKEVLETAIEKGGSTIRTYESLNVKGDMQNYLNVYGRTGEQCYTCGTKIEKIKVGGRGTHYCPSCQK